MSPPKVKPNQALALLALLLLASAPGWLLARSNDRELEAEIDAGHWLDDPQKGLQVFSKGVTLTQGSLRITAERATVYRSDAGGFDRIVLEGEPAHWEEIMDDGAELSARALTIDYNVKDDLVLLKEQVVVNKARDEITGELIRYNLDTQRLDAGSDGEGRVRIRFTPEKKPDDS
jgi:lipopolysaccharide export system protein LptA